MHIGNYIGALRQFVALQDEHESFYMLANLHAITVPIEPAAAKENVYKVAALYLAIGLNPDKATIFVQSKVPEHAQLAWLLNTITYMGELRRMTQFKDKSGGDQENVSVGLFDYPVLMAADILLYQAEMVPVGEDQKQHIELTRNLAERFNSRFGDTFTVPKPMIAGSGAKIMGLDNPEKKMSKSLGANNYISLLDDSPKIREKIKHAVTDSENQIRFDKIAKPAISNLLTIFAVVTGKEIADLERQYDSAGYGKFKEDLADALTAFLTPIQEKYHNLIEDKPALDQVLTSGSLKAQAVASKMLVKAKNQMGMH